MDNDSCDRENACATCGEQVGPDGWALSIEDWASSAAEALSSAKVTAEKDPAQLQAVIASATECFGKIADTAGVLFDVLTAEADEPVPTGAPFA
jgi:hypothetical protein